MKKITLIFLVALMFVSNIFAAEFSAGVKGDVGFSKVLVKAEIEPEPETDSVFTGRFGGVFGIEYSERFSLEPEVMFHIRNGFSLSEYMDGVGTATLTYSWTTLELPVMAKFKFNLGKGKFTLAVGPQFSFVLGDIKAKMEIGRESLEEKVTADDAGIKTFAFGIAAGAEYGLPVGSGDLVFGIRWQMDITDIDNSTDEIELRSMSILPSIAYMFKF